MQLLMPNHLTAIILFMLSLYLKPLNYSFFFFKILLFFLVRGEGRGGEGEREKHPRVRETSIGCLWLVL